MSQSPPHLLIDGSNVLHAWAETRALGRRDREAAKGLLIRKVAVLHDCLGWRVTVVFDGRGDDLNIEAVGEATDFACVHTPAGVTADDVIEQLVGRSAMPGSCLVATADQAERATIEAAGAIWCGPEELASRINSADTQQARLVSRGNDATARRWRAGGRRIGEGGRRVSEDTAYLRGGWEMSLAEMTGVDGTYIFPERILQQIWLRGEFAQDALRLNDGRSIKILKRGRWNRLPGPDFRDAEFWVGDGIGGEVIKGDVEVHLRAQDWENHGHATDQEYDRVVLHVVLFPAAGVTTAGRAGRKIPILELLPLLERDLEAYAEEAAVERLAGRPFSQLRALLVSMAPSVLSVEVERHARSRWLAKVALARRRIEILGWEEACHRRAMEVLGYRPNRDTMLMVAERWPLAQWRSGVGQPDEIWASLSDRWIQAGVRPANSPKRRLEQYERWVRERPDWPACLARLGLGLVKAGEPLASGDIRQRRREARLTDWRKRLAVEVTAEEMGGSRFDSMVCDAWLPLLAARESEQAAAAGLEKCWRDWWPGDTPAELMKLAREFGGGADPVAGVGQGTVQGLLGWLAELLEREGRGT